MIILIKAHYKEASKKDIRNLKTLKNHFQEICNKCDEILFENINNIARVANPYLHVIRAHPFFLKKYKNLIYDDNKLKSSIFRNIIKIIFFFYLGRFTKILFLNKHKS